MGRHRSILASSMRHGYLGYRVSGPLYIHVSRHRLGELFTSDTQFTLARNPATVVRSDVAFIRGDRMPRPKEHDRISRIAPDFAVEVVSPTDRMPDVLAKIARCQAAGAPLVWLVDPAARTVAVYELDREPRTLREGETLDGGMFSRGSCCPSRPCLRNRGAIRHWRRGTLLW